jgi:8-oxo-dGTP pyrophosphatase MutT (NUDIX family)
MKKYRKYVFAVAFLRMKDPQFLVLHRTKNWRGWELPKGGLKEGELEAKGLAREIFEETGARKFEVVAKTRHCIRYRYPRGFVKDNHVYYGAKGHVFLVRMLGKRVKIDRREHDRYMWIGKGEAMKMLTHKNQRNALEYVCRRYKLS